LEGSNVNVGLGLFSRNGRNVLKRAIPGFEHDPHSDLYWSLGRSKIGADGVMDLSDLLKGRDAALSALIEETS
jgi:hypothetical protein